MPKPWPNPGQKEVSKSGPDEKWAPIAQNTTVEMFIDFLPFWSSGAAARLADKSETNTRKIEQEKLNKRSSSRDCHVIREYNYACDILFIYIFIYTPRCIVGILSKRRKNCKKTKKNQKNNNVLLQN